MGTIAEKLDKLLTTKSDIKAAIIGKGQAVADADPFASYAGKIAAIETKTAHFLAITSDIYKFEVREYSSGDIYGDLYITIPDGIQINDVVGLAVADFDSGMYAGYPYYTGGSAIRYFALNKEKGTMSAGALDIDSKRRLCLEFSLPSANNVISSRTIGGLYYIK